LDLPRHAKEIEACGRHAQPSSFVTAHDLCGALRLKDFAFLFLGTFLITWSFFFTTPGVVKWSLSTDPIAWNLTGEFLFKDDVLLCVCVVLSLASLRKEANS
jgi:uncharacterized membrane protein YkgB